jgi:hypothetical protein
MANRRTHSKVAKLAAPLRAAIHDAIVKRGATYDELTALVTGWVRAGKLKAEDAPSRAALGRYGKHALARFEQLDLVREQAKAVVAKAEEYGMVLDEAATNMVLNEIMAIFMSRDPGKPMKPGDLARIAAGLGKLQQSSAAREKVKAEFQKRAGAAAKKVTDIERKGGLSKQDANVIRAKILGVTVNG